MYRHLFYQQRIRRKTFQLPSESDAIALKNVLLANHINSNWHPLWDWPIKDVYYMMWCAMTCWELFDQQDGQADSIQYGILQYHMHSSVLLFHYMDILKLVFSMFAHCWLLCQYVTSFSISWNFLFFLPPSNPLYNRLPTNGEFLLYSVLRVSIMNTLTLVLSLLPHAVNLNICDV